MSNKATIWEVVQEKTDRHKLSVKDPEGWWSAMIKRDGCVELRRYFNVPIPDTKEEDTDSMHLCDLDDTIARLQELKRMAEQYFG